jgi:transcriptional accessory protein Tex/SPT6
MAQNATMAEFEALLNESFKIDTPQEGSVVKGKVIAIEAGFAIVDVGYKMEGRVELKEFANPGEAPEVAVGDEVEVFLRQVENAKGEAVISREMARREEAWDRLEKAYADDARVDGAIFGRVKGATSSKSPWPSAYKSYSMRTSSAWAAMAIWLTLHLDTPATSCFPSGKLFPSPQR